MVKSKSGYALLLAIIAINILAILSLKAKVLWDTEIMRDLEEELVFRARQYVNAIEMYRKKNANMYPKNLEVLFEKKFLRKLYKDPISETGKWNLVMQTLTPGKKVLLVVPETLLPQFINNARLVGVSSTSNEDSFRIYRGKTKYIEWAFYLGENVNKEMPELKFINQ